MITTNEIHVIARILFEISRKLKLSETDVIKMRVIACTELTSEYSNFNEDVFVKYFNKLIAEVDGYHS